MKDCFQLADMPTFIAHRKTPRSLSTPNCSPLKRSSAKAQSPHKRQGSANRLSTPTRKATRAKFQSPSSPISSQSHINALQTPSPIKHSSANLLKTPSPLKKRTPMRTSTRTRTPTRTPPLGSPGPKTSQSSPIIQGKVINFTKFSRTYQVLEPVFQSQQLVCISEARECARWENVNIGVLLRRSTTLSSRRRTDWRS
jgi:hypothetical protein